MVLTSNECAWSNVSMKILGATVTGLKGFSFKTGIEKEHLFAAGQEPIDIQSGNKSYEGSLTLLQFEIDKLNQAAQTAGYPSILEVPHTLITITARFKKFATSPTMIVEAIGVAFREMENGMQQNDKFSAKELPFLAMKITTRAA